MNDSTEQVRWPRDRRMYTEESKLWLHHSERNMDYTICGLCVDYTISGILQMVLG